MPPKRAASASGTSAKKRAKTPADEPPKSRRWSKVSGSANADDDYKTTWKNPDKSYAFITICSPIRENHEDDDEDEENEDDKNSEEGDDQDEADDEGRDGPTCGKKGCVCFRPAQDNPDHLWLVSQAGHRKFYTQLIHVSLRDPDNFGMYTFNDHAGYGCLEVSQNLLLDYVEASERGWREQWAVCEGVALWLLSSASDALVMIDDGEAVEHTIQLVGRMFLDILAQLDNRDLVGDATDVKSLGTVMAMYIYIASRLREVGILDGDDEEDNKTFEPHRFDDAILSYANKRGVTLQGPKNIDELTANLSGEVELPEKGASDPWGWKAELKEYEEQYAGLTGSMGRKKTSVIGGDALDITTWTSAERKAASFDHKDPLGKREIDALKKGMVMQLG
ncbi:hypothetical protein F5Y04DRAFT_266047 [Hypomontagnella monticulosa]|nr:hypothetical protein F5Y04DRAFT_266047 [Hypomontagnella monticulosa]